MSTPAPQRSLNPIAIAALMAVALALATLLDPWAWAHIVRPDIYESDLGRMLRIQGFFPLWIAVSLAIALVDRGRDGVGIAEPAGRRPAGTEPVAPRPAWYARGALVVASPAVAGLLGEVIKLVVRRERPTSIDASYHFRPWSDHPFHSGGLGFPSSHAIVAFGAASMLARLFPRARAVFYLLAVGCAFTRVAARAHFFSDVVAAALLGWLTAAVLWGRFGAPDHQLSSPVPAGDENRLNR